LPLLPEQENLANAKVSARQPCILWRKACIEEICSKSTQGTQCWKVQCRIKVGAIDAAALGPLRKIGPPI